MSNSITASLIFQNQMHAAPIYGIHKGLQQNQIFTVSADKFCAAWNNELLSQAFSVKSDASIYTITTNHLNIIYFATNKGHLYIIDFENKKELKHLLLLHACYHMDYVESMQLLLISNDKGELIAISTDTFEMLFTLKLSNQKIRKFKIDANIVYAVCNDGFLYIVDLVNKKLVNKIFLSPLGLSAINLNTTNKQIIIGGKDAHLYILKSDSLTLIQKIPAHNFAIYDIQIEEKLQLIGTASRDKTIKLWDLETQNFLLRISKDTHQGHSHSVNGLLWHNQCLYSIGDDRYIKCWQFVKD